MKKQSFSFFIMAIGTFLLALGVNLFLLPHKLSTGGVSGIGTVLKYLFNIPLSVTNIALNALLFVVGYKFLGKSSIIKTVFGIIFLTVFLEITSRLPKIEMDIFASFISGSVLIGGGIGITVRQGASTGGSDFFALMVNKKKPHISIAQIIFVIDALIIALSGLVFNSFQVTIYSLTALYISSKISDYVLTLGESAKSIYIFSDKNDDISKIILTKMERGVTAIKARGMYEDREKEILLCAVTPKELPKVVSLVKEIDEKAFLIINDVHKILGEGFKKHLTI